MAFDGVLTPESASFAEGWLDFLTPWHSRTPRNASWTDIPLRDRRDRRLWETGMAGSLSGPGVAMRRERPPRGGKGCPDPWPPLPSSVARQRRGRGALSPPAPVSCGADAPGEAGTARPAPHRVVPGSQPTQCNTLGLARGSGPFEPPTGGTPLCPPSPPPLPSPSPGNLEPGSHPGLHGAKSRCWAWRGHPIPRAR